MNYLALTGAILSGVLALLSLLVIILATSGKGKWNNALGLPLNVLSVAGFGTLAVFLFNVAVSA